MIVLSERKPLKEYKPKTPKRDILEEVKRILQTDKSEEQKRFINRNDK